MPDSFFVSSKSRKRKRSAHGASTSASKPPARPKNPNGKGRPHAAGSAHGKAKRSRDEELASNATDDDALGDGIDDMELRASDVDEHASHDEDDTETPAQKRLRLAKIYLDNVKDDLADGEFDAADIDREIISSRLKKDVLEHAGKIHKFIAETLILTHPTPCLRTRKQRLPVTGAVASPDGQTLFTSSKDGSITKWDLRTGKHLSTFHKIRPTAAADAPSGTNLKRKEKGKGKQPPPSSGVELHGHTEEVLALALSDDGRFLASGGKDRRVVVWDAQKGEWLKSFGGHKDTISALAFRKGSLQLYSASHDRTIKLFDLAVMGYVETLFGHQDHVVALDALRSETAVSVGARDKTVRYWKIVEESQLVFRGGGKSAIRDILEGGLEGLDAPEEADADQAPKEKKEGKERKFIEGSIDCVAMVDETTFVSGGDSGSLCVWTTQKKKPQFTQALAHGLHEMHSETEGIVATARWITALACLRYSDLIASGSWEGDIRLWKLDTKERALTLVGSLPAPGFVNSLQFVSPPRDTLRECVWARSQEPDAAHSENRINGHTGGKGSVESLLLVAAVSQEPRLGRWMRLKDGAVNRALVFALKPRT